MISFSRFLTEAKVSQKNFEKVVDIFKRLLEKKLQTKFYRFGGPKGYTEIEDGFGIMFFYDSKKAIRFNYVQGEIESITLWKKFRLNQPGDLTVDLGGIGLLQGAHKLLELLPKPQPGIYTTHANPELKESYLQEATRIKPEDFFNLVSNNITSNQMISSLPWGVISDIAAAHDKQIPTIVRKLKVPGTRGRNARYDLTKLVSGDVADTKSTKVEKDYYIKISPQDRKTKKFMSVKGDKKAEEMLQKIRRVLNEPDAEYEMQHPDTLFGLMRNLVQVIARGTRNSLIIYGGPGIGKTYVVNKTLEQEGLSKGTDYIVVKGRITTVSLYKTLYMHRNDGKIIVFDDTDSIWGDKDAANMLKAALDSYDERKISWYSNRTVNVSLMSPEEKEEFNDRVDLKIKSEPEKPIKLPSEFIYDGRIIFISNLTKDKFDEAVLNRSAKIDMTLTTEQIFLRIKSILPYLGDPSVSIDVKEEILDFIVEQKAKGKIDHPSMRTYVAAEDLYRSGLPNWKELLQYA